jgi:threonine dehydrogenase-like Zn-dependent dehydrogenase
MKALWLSAAGLGLREDVTLAETAAQEACVRVLAAGICGTDLALADGLYPFEGVPGQDS